MKLHTGRRITGTGSLPGRIRILRVSSISTPLRKNWPAGGKISYRYSYHCKNIWVVSAILIFGHLSCMPFVYMTYYKMQEYLELNEIGVEKRLPFKLGA